MFGAEKRRVFAASNALDCNPDFRTIRFRFVRNMLPANEARSRAVAGELLSWNDGLKRAAFEVDSRPSPR
jgi:hypothetical protein